MKILFEIYGFRNVLSKRNVTKFEVLPGRMASSFDEACKEKLIELCRNNAEFYAADDSEYSQRLRLGFIGIVDHVNTILPLMNQLQKVMPQYDYDDNTPGNGYRSFMTVCEASFKHAYQLNSYVATNRESIIFRKSIYMKEVEAVSHMIACLGCCLQHLQTLLNWSSPGELFPDSVHNPEQLLEQSDTINQYAFYGRCLGIQFCSSVQPLLKFISTFMASFSEVYYNLGTFSARAQSLFSGGKFLIDPELRARRIVNISLYASIDFCKSFWFLTESELMKKIPDFVCSAIAVNTEIEIPPEPLQIPNSANELVDIPIPSSHVEIKPIQVRLLSSTRREGMIAMSSEANKKCAVVAPADGLILHCHGGGFVAQSSKSHEVYLRDWASVLDVPILSIDYSLAPEAPFPRALEEVFYSYCWAVKNCHILGSTGRKIILAGDSAGANLLLGAALKCIEYDIRKPDGLFLAYVPVIVSSTPSPSRLLCFMDPLLPIGFLLRCLKAYACPAHPECENDTKSSRNSINYTVNSALVTDATNHVANTSNISYSVINGSVVSDLDSQGTLDLNPSKLDATNRSKSAKNTFNSMKKRVSNMISNTFRMTSRKDIDKILTGDDMENLVNPFKEFRFTVPKDPHLSPYWAEDDVLRKLPPVRICSVQFDPCLDDCVMFAKKLKRLGNDVGLDILEGLPHGFLNFCKVNKDAEDGSKLCMRRIQELLAEENSASRSNGEVKNHLEDG